MAEIAYINSKFVPLENAMVHVEDRGLQFADAVYEVIRTYGGRAFAVEEHLARLFRSMDAIDLKHSFSITDLTKIIHEGIQRGGFDESMIYLQVSRGQCPRHRGIPSEANPNLILTVRQCPFFSDELRTQGIRVITVEDQRWGRCDIKTVGLLANVLAYQAARKADANDAIFVDKKDGTVSESTAGNVFIVEQGILRTPPKSQKLLAGITREKILELAIQHGIKAIEDPIHRDELLSADEIFLSGTIAEALPVVLIDGKAVGTGKPGPITQEMRKLFLELIAK